MKLPRRVLLGSGLMASLIVLILIILASTQTALVQETAPEWNVADANGRSRTISGGYGPQGRDGMVAASGAEQVTTPAVLVNDGSFENSPSAWQEQDNTGCLPWIGEWLP
ncbi:MAG TPA: hypothetical protein VEC93_08415, partial [Anaerolineae bacterium]|nr:hypothetical protein [Anaerolineae bacterium]